ncbi:MAG: RsmD family RNA methyltransferase [Planctomycetota bacterium]|jgi:16S rRNA (guanine966-N2)-methyltransferase
MRIIAGEWRGRKLEVPPGIRPMLDRERERLFSILGPAIEGARVLDLFSGSGAIGLEALSRGAAHCTSVENGRRVLPVLRRNTELLGPGDRHILLPISAFRIADLPQHDRFDFAVAAPPFPLLRDDVWRERFHGLFRAILSEFLVPGGIFVLEMPAELDPDAASGLGPEQNRRKTGASLIAFWSAPQEDPVSG